MKSFGHPDAKMQGLENLSLWQRLNSFAFLMLIKKYQKKDELLGHKVALSHKPTYSFCTVQSDLFAFINL